MKSLLPCPRHSTLSIPINCRCNVCVLIALNRFLQETNGSKIAFLDGSPTERLCEPLKEYIQERGGIIRTDSPVTKILLNKEDDTVAGLLLRGNEVISGDAYVNAMPVDAIN